MTPFPTWSAADFWTFGGFAFGFMLLVAVFVIGGLKYLESDND